MKPKLYNKHIGLDGLLYKKSYTAKDVDFQLCLKLLLEFKANPNPNPEVRNRHNKKRPTPIFQAIRNPEHLETFLGYVHD
jgi:hypothetical protein